MTKAELEDEVYTLECTVALKDVVIRGLVRDLKELRKGV